MLNFQNMLNVFRTFSLGKNCNVEKNHSCKILESRGRECVHFFSGLTFMMVSVHSVLLGVFDFNSRIWEKTTLQLRATKHSKYGIIVSTEIFQFLGYQKTTENITTNDS